MSRALLFPLFMFAFLFFVSGCYQSKEEPVADASVEPAGASPDAAEEAPAAAGYDVAVEIELTDYPGFRITQKGDQKILTKYTGSDKDVVVPEGVTEIGDRAFADCSFLTSVTIPASVTEIGQDAFEKSIFLIVPEGAKAEEYAKGHELEYCNEVTQDESFRILRTGTQKILDKYTGSEKDVVIPEGMTEIGDHAFEGCRSLTSVVIPEGVTKIGEGTFSYSRSLTSVVIPEGMTKIGEEVFFGCSSLTSVVIPEGVTEIGWRVFDGCSSLTSVVIPKGVTKIGVWTFRNCSSLTSVVIPEGVNKIGYGAFENCPKLTIHAPKGSEAEKFAKENNIPFQVIK